MVEQRYRRVSVGVLGDRVVRGLSREAQLCWLSLLVHPGMTALGVMAATAAGLSGERRWGPGEYEAALGEVQRAGLVVLDDEAGVLVVLNFLKHNVPANPNVVKGYRAALGGLAESDVLDAYLVGVRGFLGRLESVEYVAAFDWAVEKWGRAGSGYWEGVGKGVRDGLGNGFGKGLGGGAGVNLTHGKAEGVGVEEYPELQGNGGEREGLGEPAGNGFANGMPNRERDREIEREREEEEETRAGVRGAGGGAGRGEGVGLPPVSPAEFEAAWNAMAATTEGVVKPVRRLTEARRVALRARGKDGAWVREWREAVARIPACEFCLGANNRGWVASVDWFLRPDTATKLVEGGYASGGARALVLARREFAGAVEVSEVGRFDG